LEELGIDYHLECIDRVDGRYAPQSLKNVHPLGRAPAIRDGDLVLAESGAIVDYILARYGNGRFRIHYQETGFAEYLYWFHYAEASLMLQLLRESSLVRIVPDVDRHAGMDKVRLTTREHLEFIDSSLTGKSFFVGGRLTAADIMMLFPFTTLLEFLPGTLNLAAYPKIQAYVAGLCSRPAYCRALERIDALRILP
jgi:glutathione S-transferase